MKRKVKWLPDPDDFGLGIKNRTEPFYHVRVRKGELGKLALLPGDPGRVAMIVRYLKDPREIASHREYTIANGFVDDQLVTVASTGIGAPSTAIAVEELAMAGVKTFIRVGTCGPLQAKVEYGDMVIAQGAVRLEGTTKHYIVEGYPATASPHVALALASACNCLNLNHHMGIVASTDSFYAGQKRTGLGGYFPQRNKSLALELKKAGVLCFEMECSCLLTLASIYGLRAGGILIAIPATVGDKDREEREANLSRAAVKAVEILSKWDKEAWTNGLPFYLPPI